MYNNVRKLNINGREGKEKYNERNNPNNVNIRNKNRQVQYFLSKGTKIFNNFFKSEKCRNLEHTNNINKSFSSLNIFSPRTIKNYINEKSLKENKYNENDDSIEDSNNENSIIDLMEYIKKKYELDNSYMDYCDISIEDNLNDYEKMYISEFSDENYIEKENKEKDNKDKENLKKKLVDSLFLYKSKSEISFNKSDNSCIRNEIENRFNFNKQKRNWNKLLYHLKKTNNYILKKKKEFNLFNSQHDEIFEKYQDKGLEKNIEDRDIEQNKNETNGINQIRQDSDIQNIQIHENQKEQDINLLTYHEKNDIKKKAYENYVNYILKRRNQYYKCQNKKIIKKLLIANNGMAALKCIISLKQWLFKNFNDDNIIKIIVLATKDDIQSNAKYILMSDQVIEIPSGKNIYNYANVNLIVDIAKKYEVDAVWPGWGHSSENPLLSKLLEKENIIFIGPLYNVMESLGDKISANILAQSVNVPVVNWSGYNIIIDNFDEHIDTNTYNKAIINNLEECIKECKRIGFPVMIKASQGGGGKGIRKVENEKEIKNAYEQVKNELPNSPIFLMKVCNNVRHIEIQVVGDMYGNVCSLSGRDCTTQRRFQKIFEEGPPVVVPKETFREMEKASLRLTKMIKYKGAGTVEYLYDKSTNKYYFLELNPRLQVEHPVSEGITKCNLIAIQLQIAMGIALEHIDDIKRLYKIENKSEKNNSKNFEFYNFYDNEPYINDHVIAARIAAENSNDNFKPTSGKVNRISFQSSNDVWGYFSINSGSVHEYADSQIGHIFAKGHNREAARKNLILALNTIEIDGEIKNATKYLAKILESKDFIENNTTTNWLDTIIKKKKFIYYNALHIIILCAAIFKILCYFLNMKEKVEESINRDDIAIKKEDINTQTIITNMKKPLLTDIIFENIKYSFKGYNTGENLYKLVINNQEIEILAEYDKENKTVYTTFHNQTYIYNCFEDSLGIHMILHKDNIFIPNIVNPFHLISNMNGKIVRYLINNNEEINKNDDYIEVEAMKMIMTFKATETGILKHKKSAGSIIKIGDLLGIIEKKQNNTKDKEKEEQKEEKEEKEEIKTFNEHLILSNKYPYEFNDFIIKDSKKEKEQIKKKVYTLFKDNLNNTKIEKINENDTYLSTENYYKNDINENFKKISEILEDEIDDTEELENDTDSNKSLKNRLYLKQQKKKKIFRLYSCKNIDVNKIIPLHLFNDKINTDNNSLNDLTLTKENSLNFMKNENNSSKYFLSDTISLNNRTTDSISINTTNNNLINNDNLFNDTSTIKNSYDESGNDKKEIYKIDNVNNNNNNFNNNNFNNNNFNNNNNNNNELDNINKNFENINNELKDNYLLDINNMKRIEYLLKGYEQNVEECFKKLINNKNEFFLNINFILEKFIEYNILFSKNKNISEIEIYENLYNNVIDKKKQYEIIHAYMYNYLSIQLIELILKYLIENKNIVLPNDILNKINILSLFNGNMYGSIVFLSNFLIYLNNNIEFINNLENLLHYNVINKDDKNILNNFIKKEGYNYYRLLEMYNNNNYEKIVKIFLKNSSTIHIFLQSLFTFKKNCIFVEMYLKNLYTYYNIKTKWVSNNVLKFSINNSDLNNVLIINQNDEFALNIENILNDEDYESDTTFKTIHIINLNDNFFNSFNNLNVTKKCNKFYVYNYALNKYGDIHHFNLKKENEETIINENLNLLPYEEKIFLYDDILKYYDIKSVEGNNFYQMKIFLGTYKKDTTKNSLFCQKLIDINNIKNIIKYKNIENEKMKMDKKNDLHIKEKMFNILLQELKDSMKEVEIGRNNLKIKDNKISSYLIYHIVINELEDIDNIKKIFKRFLNDYNELFLENYVNDVYINIYSKINNNNNNDNNNNINVPYPNLKLEKILRLHVLFNKEKNIIEEVKQYSSFEIDTLYNKRQRARDIDTIYAYDFIRLLDISLNRNNKKLNDEFNYINSIKEFKLKYIKEHILSDTINENIEKENNSIQENLFDHYDANISTYEKNIQKSLYLSNNLNVGQNKVSIIAFLLNIKTDEYPNGREVVFILNDITTNGGSFSIVEDEIFYAVSSYARHKKIPRIYISCNSGARIGLYNYLMDKIKISWNYENNKELGYKYLYITEEVKNQIPKEDIVFLKEIQENNEKRYIIDAIVGNIQNPVGVENLRGSGLIAGETSKAYDEIFTLSYVTGRSVGIGAYLVRLGKRTIQKKGSSLLLTGFNALNKLLGEKVYVSNEQLGGVNIMLKNGISQLIANNDQDGFDKIIKWLSYVPKTSEDYFDIFDNLTKKEYNENNLNNVHTIFNDSINEVTDKFNDVHYLKNNKNIHSNTKIKKINDIDMSEIDNINTIDLIKGTNTKQGFLDKGTYFEYMSEWGKGIITGRGKLGSIPVGFISVNKNLVHQTIPCDPVLKVKSLKIPQAPCVFFPDNSYKTAQAIEDFNKENLPLFIFANWRGFSGGSVDMFNSILKFGSMIVNQLVNYKHPVFVYIPIWGELRGGSWVVVDETLNNQIIEMYADTTSKGGILEPPGIVEIKFRNPEIKKLMHNTDSTLIELDKKLLTVQGDEIDKIKKKIEKKEKEIFPFYLQVCHKYADLHDVAICMKSKNVIKKIVPWKKSRSFFYYRLLRRLLINILNKKFCNSLVHSKEIKKIIDQLVKDDEDDFEACKKILNENTLKQIKELSNDLTYNKVLNDLYKTFKILTPQHQNDLINKIKSLRN